MKFDKKETVKEEFIHAGATKELIMRPMMHQTGEFDYAETDGYQALRLPYGNGSYAMTVLLPMKETNALPKVPTVEEWEKLNKLMAGRTVDVKLPSFETDTNINLKPIMMALGMTEAFDDRKANFPNFCDVSVYIQLMKQVAKIKLDEEGTEASAVTVVGVDWKSMPSYTAFHANHPFLYVISEQQTGAVFFIGQYTGY